MGPAALQFESKLQTCIRMGITIFKIFIWGGISSDIYGRKFRFTATRFIWGVKSSNIRSEITFNCSVYPLNHKSFDSCSHVLLVT